MNKRKIILSSLIFLFGVVASLYLSTYLHFLLNKQMETLKPISPFICMKSIAASRQHLMLFLCLIFISGLLAIFQYFTNSKPYQSDLVEITPYIKTPVSTGQYQFGSARWLTEQEKETVFQSFILDTNHNIIKSLLFQGYDDKAKQDCNAEKSASTKGGDQQEEVEQNYLKEGGIVLGKKQEKGMERIFYIGEDVHTLCIGATRCGKTRSEVLQTIGVLGLAGESLILSDPKAELFQYTAPYLERLGYEVITIDFKTPLKSHRYNFLQSVIDAIDENDVAKAVDATWDITSQLVGESKGERIWNDGEASIIASSIMSVVYDNQGKNNRKYQNMTNVFFFISEMCKSVNGKMPIVEYVKKLKSSHPAKGLLAISEVAPDKTRGSFFTAALTTLRLFTNPYINAMTNCSDYNPMDIGKKKMALFIILPDEKNTYFPLASLLVNQHYSLLAKSADVRGGRLKRRVNFILDEFGNFVKIPTFTNMLTVGGGRGMRFNIFIQAFSQLDTIYEEKPAQTIKANCENWIYLQSDEPNTLRELSEKLGKYTVSTYSLSASNQKFTAPSSSQSINLVGRELLTSDEIRLIKRPDSLLTSRNHPAMMFSPDISQWEFNQMFGLGDKEFNIKLRMEREKQRKTRVNANGDMDLWNIWLYYIAALEQKVSEPAIINGMKQSMTYQERIEKRKAMQSP